MSYSVELARQQLRCLSLGVNMKPICTALALWLFFCPLAAAQEADTSSWSQYRNENFGFSLFYPTNVFHVEKRSEAGDGLVFATKDGEARLLVGAFKNSDHQTPAAYQEFVAKKSYADYTITYRRLGGTWFVLSGEARGRLFYEKVMFSCSGQLINSFAILYPADQQRVFDPIVERMENSFRPGTACEQHAAQLVKPRAKQKLAKPASRKVIARAHGARSPLADRIARERGRDVIVILRRNGPPYDRKVLRGYVSR